MFNILNYLNSKDVANYLKEINYVFSPLESAWIIWHSFNHTISQKNDAFVELIKKTDDCEIPQRYNCRHYDSLHSFLREYIDENNRKIESFKLSNNCYYTYTIMDDTRDISIYHSDNYLDFKSLLYAISVNLDEAEIKDYKDIKIYVDKYNSKEVMKSSRNYQNLRCCESSILNSDFDFISFCGGNYDDGSKEYDFMGMCIFLPVPFKKGDILYNPYSEIYNSFVYDHCINDIDSRYVKENGDNTDMCAYGYYCDGVGNVMSCDCAPYGCAYIDLEYYNNELYGNSSVLKYISDYLKGKICLDGLLNYYHGFLLNNESEKYMLNFNNKIYKQNKG